MLEACHIVHFAKPTVEKTKFFALALERTKKQCRVVLTTYAIQKYPLLLTVHAKILLIFAMKYTSLYPSFNH